MTPSFAITLIDQKNGEKFQTVHVERAAVKDPSLCCVHNLAANCRRIAAYTHTTPILLRKICMFQAKDGTFSNLSASRMIRLLRKGADSMGFAKLGFRPEEIGTHSIRSGGSDNGGGERLGPVGLEICFSPKIYFVSNIVFSYLVVHLRDASSSLRGPVGSLDLFRGIWFNPG